MKTSFLALAALLGLFVLSASAADVSGKWVADVPGRQGNTMQTTFNLQASGSTLSGTVATQRGEMQVENGKVEGDTVTFSTTMKMQDREMKFNYTGKISGDSINFTRTMEGMDRKQEFTAKRSTT